MRLSSWYIVPSNSIFAESNTADNLDDQRTRYDKLGHWLLHASTLIRVVISSGSWGDGQAESNMSRFSTCLKKEFINDLGSVQCTQTCLQNQATDISNLEAVGPKNVMKFWSNVCNTLGLNEYRNSICILPYFQDWCLGAAQYVFTETIHYPRYSQSKNDK
jgi:hypothetical protein